MDLSPYTLVATEHSTAAAQSAVALAREQKVDALMQGSLAADELMKAALAANIGLRTGRRMSHIWLLDVPTYARPLLLTDALLNIYPDLHWSNSSSIWPRLRLGVSSSAPARRSC